MARPGLNPGRLVPQSVLLAELEVQHGDRVAASFEFRKPQCCAPQVKALDFLCSLDKSKDMVFHHSFWGRQGGAS